MSRLLPTLATVLTVLLATPAAGASELDVDKVHVDYPEVSATVTAPPELAGQKLNAEAFAVTEDGEPRKVRVRRLASDELEVVLLVDTSGSMRSALDAAKRAALRFLDRMPPTVRVAVVGFGNQPRVEHRFTTDRTTAAAAIDRLEAAGETALHDAVLAAADLFSKGRRARRSVVLLSDGGDTASSARLDEAARGLARSDVRLYAVRLGTAESNAASLRRLSRASQGRVVAADDADALQGVYERIASDLVNQYKVSYRATAHGPVTVTWGLETKGVRAQADTRVQLPAAPPASRPEPLPDAPPRLQVVSVDNEDYPEVRVRVIAPRPLAEDDLESGDFHVVEDGVERHIRVSEVHGVDLDVVLLVDTSGSMHGEPLSRARGAAQKFIDGMPTGTRVAIVTFADEVAVASEFTGDRRALRATIDALRAEGETALFDAAVRAAQLLEGRENAARSVVLLSDGEDTVSGSSPAEAAERLKDVGAAVHAVFLDSPETNRPALEQLVTPSDGSVVTATEEALEQTFAGLAADVGNQYILSYRSQGHGPVQLQVGVDRDGVTAETARTVELPPLPFLARLLTGRWGLWMGAAAVYFALAIIVLMLLLPGRTRTQIWGAVPRRGTPQGTLSELAERAVRLAEHGLARRGADSRLNAALERAGVNLRSGEFAVLVASVAVAAGALGLLVSGLVLGLLLAAVTAAGARLVLGYLTSRRQNRFAEQLSDTLQLLSGSLRAGYGILQAIDSVAREADRPTAEEFRRVLVETRLGRDLGDALDAMANRLGSADFEWVVQALEIHREIGGDLAEILDNVAGTIRERNQVRRQIKALSAEGRLSAYVLLALPFGVGAFIAMSNPGYVRELFVNPVGLAMVGAGLVLMVVGAFWMRKIVRLVF